MPPNTMLPNTIEYCERYAKEIVKDIPHRTSIPVTKTFMDDDPDFVYFTGFVTDGNDIEIYRTFRYENDKYKILDNIFTKFESGWLFQSMNFNCAENVWKIFVSSS
jgi:hypothetical protein